MSLKILRFHNNKQTNIRSKETLFTQVLVSFQTERNNKETKLFQKKKKNWKLRETKKKKKKKYQNKNTRKKNPTKTKNKMEIERERERERDVSSLKFQEQASITCLLFSSNLKEKPMQGYTETCGTLCCLGTSGADRGFWSKEMRSESQNTKVRDLLKTAW